MTTDPAYEPTPTPHGYNAEDLTAFALNELDPDSDTHRAIVAALANDPAIRAEIDAITGTAQRVSDALAHEPAAASCTGILPVAPSQHSQGNTANQAASGSRAPLFARPALLAAGFALAAGAAVTVVSMLQPGPGHTPIANRATAPRGIDAIHAALQAPVTASFQDAPLREVLDEVQRTTHAELHVDWDALAERGVSPETRLTFDADGLPARDLLSLALAAAWQQLPHPDPAVWSVGPEAVHIEPRSSLVLRSLAQAQTALAAANPTDNRLTPRQATLADHPAWQRPGEVTDLMLQQRTAQRLMIETHRLAAQAAEAAHAESAEGGDEQPPEASDLLRDARRQLAEQKAADAAEAAGAGQWNLAVQLYEEAAMLAPQDETVRAGLAAAQAQRNPGPHPVDPLTHRAQGIAIVRQETAARYEQAARRAQLALDKGEYDAAIDAVIEARTVLNANRSAFGENERNELVARAARMQTEINNTRSRYESEMARRAAMEQEAAERDATHEADQRRSEEVQARLRSARELQANRDYAGALAELEAAQFLDPDNAAIESLRELTRDAVAGTESVRLRRELDLMRSNQQLIPNTDGLPEFDRYAVPSVERLGELSDAPNAASMYYAQGLGLNAGDGYYLQDGLSRYDSTAGDVMLGTSVQHYGVQLGRSPQPIAAETGFALANRPAATAAPARGAGGLRDRSGSAGRGLERGETVLAEDLVRGIAPEEPDHDGDGELGDKLATLQEQQAQLQQRLFEFQRPGVDPNQLTRDTYALVNDNPFHTGLNDPLSTFSVDVDTAAYTLVRRQVQQQHSAPVPGAVRIEELINYFDYRYTAPVVEPEMLDHGVVTQASIQRLAADDDTFAPFATHVEVADCPWAEGHQLVRIGIKGMEVAQEDRPAAHLTFLLDVSGSMSSDNKLPLVKESMRLLLTQLNPEDHVSIVVYAGAAGLVLENASAGDPAAIEDALNKLSAGGSTAGGAGIELAYKVAQDHYVPGGVNRVILCTDGDFNVGISDRDQLVELIKQKANPEPDADGQPRGVYLSVLGYGMGNLNDQMMEPLTNAGNGHYAYIDSAEEAQKVMVEQVGGTLVAIAKDVKVQVEFNPSRVLAYRLIGYENRILAAEDFANDTVDAGDIGAGHTVTALYEVVPFPDDGLGDEEALRQVKLQLEALDEALAFSTSVLQNTPLTDEQYRKLAGSIRLMQQQRDVAAAVQSRAKRVPPAITAAGGIEMRYRDDAGFIDGLDAVEELMVVNLRYKPVDAPAEQGTSRLIQTTVGLDAVPFSDASEDTRFAAAVAGFGMVLRNSPHRGDASMQWVIDTAGGALTHDPHGYRAGFVSLAEQTQTLLPDDPEKDRNVLEPADGREPIRER